MPDWDAIGKKQAEARRRMESDMDRHVRLQYEHNISGGTLFRRLNALEERVAELERKLEDSDE